MSNDTTGVPNASFPIVIPPTGPRAPVPAADGPSPIEGRLRKAPLRVPDIYDECSGFTLFGRKIRSLLYSTDVAVIRNSNADAIFAVYPFTAQPAITQALLTVAEAPLFVGVGGGTTTGRRAAELAAVSEMQGAAGATPPPSSPSCARPSPTCRSSPPAGTTRGRRRPRWPLAPTRSSGHRPAWCSCRRT